MRLTAIHNIFIVCILAFAFLFTSCVGEEESLSGSENSAKSFLVLRVGTVGGLRDITSALSDIEKMHSLRIVILNDGGRVEKNLYVPFDNAVQEYVYRSVEVTPGHKKVFLFANEESATGVLDDAGKKQDLSFFLNNYQVNATGFENEVKSLRFAPDYSAEKPIQMSSVYEVDVPSQGVVEKDFFVVRNATKFSVRFTNRRDKALTIKSLTLSSMADWAFVMPHKQNLEMEFVEADGSKNMYFWIDWLEKVSQESQAFPNDRNLADRRGWIMDYDIPAEAVHSEYVNNMPGGIVLDALVYDNGIPKPGKADCQPFYLPESKNLKSENLYGEQEYFIKVKVTDHRNNEDKELSCPLDNLRALFRSTHVVIDVSFSNDNGILVDVIPYSEVILEPEFGL